MAREEKTLTELELQPTANVDRANDYLWTVDTSDTSMSAYGTSKKVKVEAFIGDTGEKGDPGDEIELQKTDTHVQWRYVGGTWTNLIALEDITGPQGIQGEKGEQGEAGSEIEIQKGTTHIQWRYVGDALWTDLIAISEITGPQGIQGIQGDPGVDGEGAYVYIAYASDSSGTGFTMTFNPALDYIAIKSTNTEITTPQASDFTGLWKNYKGATGATGPQGEIGLTGEAGEDAYVYIAYASDDSGTDFTTTFNPALDYIAIKSTNTEIPAPQASDFTGLWKNYKGAKGDTGPAGADGEDGLDINWRGTYSALTSYVVNDAVFYEGSSYICILASTGNLPTNETYWNLMAQEGAAGEGSGDVSGPSSSTDNAVARFDLTTGRLIQNSLVTIDDNGSVNIPTGQQYLVNGSPVEGYSDEQAQDAVGTILTDTAEIDLTYTDETPSITADIKDASIANAKLANMTTKTYKGRTSATTGVPEDVPVATLKSDLSLAKADVGLGNVDNTSDATKNSAVATLTNKTINADNNTISNLETDNLKTGVLDTDLSSVSALDDTLASAKAIKAYTDSKGYTWKGAWTTSTSYSVNDTVENNGSGYVCKTAHTSGTFATDLSAGKWELFVEGLPDPNITTSTTTDLTGLVGADGSNIEQVTKPTGAIVGTTDTQTLTNKTIDGKNNTITNTNPSGSIMMFGGSSAPTGYLLCDGSAVSRTTYADLFTAIGTTYGVGDGSTTFNVPNVKGKVPVGRDSADTSFDTLGETGGVKSVTLTSAQSGLPAHSHSIKGAIGAGNYSEGVAFGNDQTPDYTSTFPIQNNTAQNASQAHTNLQPYIVLNYIIKT